MFYYFYRFLLSSCVCHLLIKFMMMMRYGGTTCNVKVASLKSTRSQTDGSARVSEWCDVNHVWCHARAADGLEKDGVKQAV